MSERAYENVGDFVLCFQGTQWKGVGTFNFAVKKGGNASPQQSADSSPPSSNIEGCIVLDQHSSKEIEHQFMNHFTSGTPVKIKGNFKDKLMNTVEAWTLIIKIADVHSQRHGKVDRVTIALHSAFAAKQLSESIDLSSC